MYVPGHFAMTDAEVRDFLVQGRAADLITSTAGGLMCTLLPFVYDEGAGAHGALLGHLARNNDQWRHEPLGEALAVVRGPDAYVSPSWYPSKAEHGRVVPTWNYVQIHTHGRLVVHDDPDWVRDQAARLTREHEEGFDRPWSVDDAPGAFVSGQLRAVVGVELRITRIEAKAKLSQNRSAANADGVVAGLTDAGEPDAAAAVREARRKPA
jgi:transcriptional regulator